MKSNKKKGLSNKQIRAIPALISAKNCTEGCKKAKIAPKTFYQWLKAPIFKEELKRQRDLILEDALESLKASMAKAVDTLKGLLDTTDSDSLKRFVANDIISYVIKARELEDLDKRVSDLEAAIRDPKS